jgi:predicted metal-dependent peptidase
MSTKEQNEKKLMQARLSMLEKFPFLGALAMRIEVKLDESIPVACCNGITVKFNPRAVENMTSYELIYVYAHEVLHVAFEHSLRLQYRNPLGFNIAGDYAINAILNDYGLKMPKGGLFDKRFAGMNAEQIYNILEQEKQERQNQKKQNQQGQGKKEKSDDGEGEESESEEEKDSDDKSADGKNGKDEKNESDEKNGKGEKEEKNDADDYGLSDEEKEALENGKFEKPSDENQKPLSQDEINELQEKVKEAVMEAVNLERNQPNGLSSATKRLIKEAEARISWADALRNYIQNLIKDNFTWKKPAKKWLNRGFYLPSIEGEGINKLRLAIDTSGSMNEDTLSYIASEINQLKNQLKINILEVIYCDDKINRVDTFDMYDEVKLEMLGGRGTDFKPVFEYSETDDPDLLVYFTDLFGEFPKQAPEYPVMWAVVGCNSQPVPFGERIQL